MFFERFYHFAYSTHHWHSSTHYKITGFSRLTRNCDKRSVLHPFGIWPSVTTLEFRSFNLPLQYESLATICQITGTRLPMAEYSPGSMPRDYRPVTIKMTLGKLIGEY
ncbi:hypothetical protein RF11_10191 [Thelohanellus kitauei]|uniref:Uncharacterized protein n=1 Tax=Thelohanellus kitauei TaxID=669202 RepID=A0A0C2NDS0_THEKT|nr:hypothetical protein RF11_10191 [Thelohanellus kitauei]